LRGFAKAIRRIMIGHLTDILTCWASGCKDECWYV